MVGLRMGVPFAILLPLMISRGLALGGGLKRGRLVAVSLLNALRSLLYVISFKYIPVGIAVTLLYVWPVFALLFHCVADRKWPRPEELGVLFLAFSGVAVINWPVGTEADMTFFLGSVAMLMSAAIYSITVLMFKSILSGSRELETVYFQNALGGVIFIAFLIRELPEVSIGNLALGLVYGASVGILTFSIIFWALKRITVFQYSALSYVEVVFGLLYGMILLNEKISGRQFVGMLLILGSSILAHIFERRDVSVNELSSGAEAKRD